jgi:hypothetical protein
MICPGNIMGGGGGLGAMDMAHALGLVQPERDAQ